MFGWFTRFFAKDVGIDLGTANIVVYVRGRGIAFIEPSVVALRSGTREVVVIGSEAKRMLGKTPEAIRVVKPLRDGVISDFDVTSAMIKHFIRLSQEGSFIKGSPRVVICVPSGVTDVERKAVVDVTLEAGAREAYLIEEPIAAAIGAGLMIHEPRGNMVVDIGGGTTEVAVMSLGGIVVNDSLRIAGDELDAAVVDMMRQEFGLLIGEQTAEEIKMTLGNVQEEPEDRSMEVKGRDMVSGLPKVVRVRAAEVKEALLPLVDQMVDLVKGTLERTPPELVRDIIDQGIMLTGGGAMLLGLDAYFSRELEVPVFVAEKPLLSVALGIGRVLEELDVLKKVLVDFEDKSYS